MRSSRRALRELERNDLASAGELPINLVPMIDILTVLVLYLLVGTIFKHFAILELNLPGPAQPVPADQPPPLQLTITMRSSELIVSDRFGVVNRIATADGAYDLATLSAKLTEIKRRNPNEDSVTVMLEPDIAYEHLVAVMDATRLFPPDTPEGKHRASMFPTIAIGDAPPIAEAAPAP